MTLFTRRRLASLFVTAAAGSVLAEAAFAQGATNAPPGGVPSTTAPSNSQGTPSGGTGVIGGTTTRANPSVSPSPDVASPSPSTAPAPTRRHRRRHRRRHTTTTTTPTPSTSQ